MIYKYSNYRPRGIMGDGINQRYFTNIGYGSSYEAMAYNAIPYEPIYRTKILLKNNNDSNFGDPFPDEVPQSKIRKVWAAFGLHGGGYEMIDKGIYVPIEDPTIIHPDHAGSWAIDKELSTGGYRDEYATFIKKTTTIHGKLYQLLQEVLTKFKNTLLERGDPKRDVKFKMLEDILGGSIYYKINDFEYTISILAKANEFVCNGLRIWGVFWQDEYDKRKIFKFIEYRIPGYPLFGDKEFDNSYPRNEFMAFIEKRFDDLKSCLYGKSQTLRRESTEYSYVQFPSIRLTTG